IHQEAFHYRQSCRAAPWEGNLWRGDSGFSAAPACTGGRALAMKTDGAIAGGGPGGSAAALHLSRAAIPFVLIGAARFTRSRVRESVTGACGNCLRSLELEVEMSARRHPIKYGVTV